MTIAGLGYIQNLMESMGIPYAFMEWQTKPPDTYFTGTYIEHPSTTLEENGHQETTFILRGYTPSQAWMKLEEYKALIEKNVAKTAVLDDGTGIAVFYEAAQVVPTFVDGWKSIKINLKIQEWKVN